MADKDAKHPDVIEGTPQEKAALVQNTVALRPRQTLYIKIRGYSPIETDKSDVLLDAADAFERACRQADVDVTFDVSVTPPSEAQEKRVTDKAAKKAEDRRKADEQAAAAPKH